MILLSAEAELNGTHIHPFRILHKYTQLSPLTVVLLLFSLSLSLCSLVLSLCHHELPLGQNIKRVILSTVGGVILSMMKAYFLQVWLGSVVHVPAPGSIPKGSRLISCSLFFVICEFHFRPNYVLSPCLIETHAYFLVHHSSFNILRYSHS